MSQSVDALVLGLGPAGASAAAELACGGRTVVALDRKKQAGLPVQCAEFVPALLEPEPGTVAQRIDSMLTFVEEDAGDLKPEFPGRMLDRAAFDSALVRKAQDAGAECRFGCSARKISGEGLVELSDGDVLQARVIVGADGPRSLAGKAIGSINTELVETRQITVPLLGPYGATDIFLSAAIPGGYGWLFPKKDVANLGAGVSPQHKRKLKGIVERLHRRLIREKRVGADILSITGGAIPVGGMLRPRGLLQQTVVLLAGDAAGLANPVTGAGIAAAVYSGRLAGRCGVDLLRGKRDSAQAYEEELEDLFGAALARAVRRRRELMQSNLEKAALKRGWIAYPEYWV